MAGNEQFEMVQDRGWLRGLNNLMRGEASSWLGRWRWLKLSLIWVGMINFILLMVILSTRNTTEGVPADEIPMLYGIFGGMFTAIGIVIAMQGSVVGEKRSGTASWILSKPVSRPAFILAKGLGNAIGILICAILIPALLAYLSMSLLAYGRWLPLGGFSAAVAILAVHGLFWLTFTLMLGALFDSWAPVIGIPMALLFGQQFLLSMLPALKDYLPYVLVTPLGGELGETSIAGGLIMGQQPASWLPVISTAVLSLVWVVIAVWAFNKQEL